MGKNYLVLVLVFLSFLSCKTYKDVVVVNNDRSKEDTSYVKQNHEKYKEQEIRYYQYALKSNGEEPEKLITDKKEEPIVNTNSEVVNHKKELIQTLENKGLKPCKLVERTIKKRMYEDSVHLGTEERKTLIKDDKNTSPEIKSKVRAKCGGLAITIGKILSTVYFIFLAITNFHLFTMIFPTSICLLACICYPIWWKRGYLDTPYAKIATFIAAYGGLFANILWVILYI